LGYNYRMDDIRASLGIIQFKKLQLDLEKRIEIRNMYLDLLSDIPRLIIPFSSNTEFVSNYIFPILIDNSTAEHRDKIRDKLHKKGIQTSVHYPAIHRFSIYSEEYTDLPITDYIADNQITLPMYSKLNIQDIRYISQSVKNSLDEK